MEKLSFGDWFILMQLCKNVHPEIFEKIVTDLRDRMDPKLSDNMEMGNYTPLLQQPQANSHPSWVVPQSPDP